MNVVANAGYGAAWIVRNMPILPSSYGVCDNQAVFFDITSLGISPGTQLSSMNVVVTVASSPQVSQPTGDLTGVSVSTLQRRSTGGVGFSLPSDPGSPKFFNPNSPPTDIIHHQNVPAVQEGINCCLPGSLARSIKWLDTEYDLAGLAPAMTAQLVYDNLITLQVGAPFYDAATNTYTDMIRNKANYLHNLDSRALTKILDLSNSIGPIPGVPEDNTTDFVTWLYRELPKNDVELHYDDHIVTVTGIFKLGDNVILQYRDDEFQGNPNNGDTAEKMGRLFNMGGLNQYNFLTIVAGFDVKVAFSEAVIPEPATMTILGFGAAGLVWLRRRRCAR